MCGKIKMRLAFYGCIQLLKVLLIKSFTHKHASVSKQEFIMNNNMFFFSFIDSALATTAVICLTDLNGPQSKDGDKVMIV